LKIIVKKQSIEDERAVISIVHHNEELDWMVEFLETATKAKKSVFAAKVDPYELINRYWETLSPQRQDQIFAVYREINDIFASEHGYDYEALTRALLPRVAQLIEMHDIEEVKNWSDYRSNAYIPTNDPKLLVSYDVANTSKKPREGTYLLEDYKWLIAVSVMVRCVIPIWGTYIYRVQRPVGTNFKEYKAYQLLNQSDLFEHPAMQKLRDYVRFNTKPDQVKMSAMRKGLSTEEYSEWMLGVVVVRKLGCLDFFNRESTTSCITVLYNYIAHKLKNSDNSFGGAITEKKFEGTQGEGENNLSTLEGYRTPVAIAQGNITAFQVYAERTANMASQLCPGIDLRQVQRCISSVKQLHAGVPSDEQLIIMQMTVKKVLSPQALKLLNHETIMGVMGVVQAVLWHRGYPELAALATAKELPDRDLDTGPEHRSRILDAQLEELRVLYPYQRRPTAKAKVDQSNVAQQEIENIEKKLSKKNWTLTLPKEWVVELNRSEINRRYFIPSNLRIRLAEFVITVAKGEF
jgi:hypothetical protein